MKIIHVINSLGSGGAEKLVVEMCNYLSRNKHQVGLFTFVSDINFFEKKLDKSVVYYKNKNLKYYSLTKTLKLFKAIRNYDIIHVHLFPPFYIVALLTVFFKKKKFVYTEHNTYNNRRKNRYRLLEKFIYSRYSKITCISVGVKDTLLRWIPLTNTVLINNFVIIDEIEREHAINRKLINLSMSDKVIVMVGSFRDTQKDQQTLIKSLIHLPAKFKLILIGDGVLRNESENLAKNLGVQDRVFFLRNREDVYSILKTCDYGVLSSNWEGFGIVALEYIACGLPAIGTDVEGLNEVITEKECLFEIGNDRQLAEIILRLDTNKVKKECIIKEQQLRLQNYNIYKIMTDFTTLYNSI